MSGSTPSMNPFPGLRPFTQEEDYLFFGREEQTIELLQRLGGARFVAVVGTSGSGKSSLVRCGLLSELLGGKMLQAGASWEIAVTHPGGNPLALLAESLMEADLYDAEEDNVRENLLATLSRSHFGLVEAVKQSDLGEGTNFLLVVDQFEEIFRFHEAGQTQREMANEFVSVLLEAVAQTEVPIYVVLTMRSDFIGECGQFEGLAEMVNRGEFLIPRLSREQYKRVIEGPIKVAGGQITPRLLQRLLNDLGQQADQLPCLQHALMRTWNVWKEHGQTDALDLDDYQNVGRMSQALSLHADEIYDSLASDRQRQLCRGLFQALTVQESESRGIRRPQRLGRLCQILEVPVEELLPIIDAYRQSGVTFLMPPADVELSQQTIIDISHESLMRVWTRLRHWVEEESQAAGIYRRLSESASLYEQGKAGLFRDPELGIALAWRDELHPNAAWAERYHSGFATAMSFLDASQQASVAEEQAMEAARQRELQQAKELAEAQQLRLELQQRSAGKLRKLIGGLAVVAAIAGLACIAALVANNRAKELAQIATKEAASALEAKQATEVALDQVESQKTQVENSLTKAERAERTAVDAERRGRDLLYATDMQLAVQQWKDERVGAQKLQDQLAAHVPHDDMDDLRGFEWYYSQNLVNNSAQVFSGHEAEPIDSALTEDGQLIVLDKDARLVRWDRETGSQLGQVRGIAEGQRMVKGTLRPDGHTAAIASDEDRIHLVDTATGKELLQLPAAPARIGLIFSPDARMLVSVDAKIQWWDARSGRLLASSDTNPTRVSGAVAISQDGLTVLASGISGSLGGEVSIFQLDLATKKIVRTSRDFGSTRGAAALSPDGQLLATCDMFGGAVSIYETKGFAAVASNLSAHGSAPTAMAFSADSSKLITADGGGMIKIWSDPRTLDSPQFTLKGHAQQVTNVFLAEAGKRLVSASVDKTVRIWELPQPGSIQQLTQEERGLPAQAVRFSPDGLLIAAADSTNQLSLWDAANGRRLRTLPGEGLGMLFATAFSPDNRLLAAGYSSGTNLSEVVLWDIDTGEQLAVLTGTTDLPGFKTESYSGIVNDLAFSPDGKFLVAGFGTPHTFGANGSPNPLKVWDVATRRLMRVLHGHNNFGTSLTFSADGTRMASGNYDGTARIWDTQTWKTLHILTNPSGTVMDVAFSPDAKTLAMASYGGGHEVQLWDAETGVLRESLKGHSNSVSAVAFSPDGRTLVSAGWDQTVRLWNVATSRELMDLESGSVDLSDIFNMCFSPDGRQLMTGGGRVAFWSTAPSIWSDADRAAEKLAFLRDSAADFRSRIRLHSSNVQLHEALARLQQQRPDDLLVQTALAAAQAHWHAWREEFSESAEAVERLVALSPEDANEWLSTEALLRVATALVHQNQPARAAAVLTGGAERRKTDGLAALSRDNVTGEKTRDETASSLSTLINEKLKEDPQDPGLLEVRAELAGQWSDTDQQLADYTAAIEVLSTLPPDEANASLMRLVHRRGDVYFASNNWQAALDDYDRVVTDETTDVALLTNHAMARSLGLIDGTWTVLKPTQWKSEGGATLTLLEDNSILASGVNPDQDAYKITANAPLQRITAIRLEVIPDPSLPKNGPGRYPNNGNLHLNEFRVLVDETPHEIAGIYLSHQDRHAEAEHQKIIDGIVDNSQWSIFPRSGERHFAVFATDIELAEDDTLTLELVTSRASFPQHNVGRFRLSVSDDPKAFVNTEKRLNAEELSDPWARLAIAYQLEGNEQKIEQLVQRLPRAAVAFGDLHVGEKDFQRAIDFYNIALAVESSDADLLSKQARAFEQIQDWPSAAADWSRAAADSSQGAKLLVEFAGRLAERGLTELAATQSLQAQQRYEAMLARDPGNPIIAESLAALLLGRIKDESVIVPTSEAAGVLWHWTTTQPADDWMNVDFDDLAWQTGSGGFGTSSTPRSIVRTDWNTSDIWLRRSFEYSPDQASSDLAFRYFYDDEAEVYFNGKQVLTLLKWTGAYENKPLDADAVGALQPGTNTIAVHCHQNAGGQYIDVGMIRGEPSAAAKRAREVAQLSDPALRLAAAYAINGDIKQSAIWFGRTIDDADSNEARATIVDELGRHDEVLTAVLRNRPDDLPLQLARAKNLAKASTEASDPTLADVAFRDLQEAWIRLDRIFEQSPEPQWTVLEPTEMSSEGGASLTLQKDGSILASGQNANVDTYTIVAPSALKRITSVRLEALTDPSLPQNGPGRYENGNFSLTKFRVSAGDLPALLSEMSVTFSENDQFASVIGSKLSTGYWGIYPRSGVRQSAIFEANLTPQIGDLLKFELSFARPDVVQHPLGRFRLALTDEPNAFRNSRFHLDSPDAELAELAELAAALGHGYARRGQWAEAKTSFTTAIGLAKDRGVKQKIITRALGFDALLESMAQHFLADGQFQAAVAEKFLRLGQPQLASAAKERARALIQADLADSPEDVELVEQLADLLLADHTTHWTILEPVEMTSEGGATLSKLSDNSILASGKNPLGDIYSIVAEGPVNRVSAIRLEALTDPSLPADGPGRDEARDRGNFHMINLEVRSRVSVADELPIQLSQAVADFTVQHIPLSVREWNVGSGGSRPHTAVYLLQEPLDFEQRVQLQFRMQFFASAEWPRQNLGRFRLAVSSDAGAFERAAQHFNTMSLTDPWSKLALAYYLVGDVIAAEAILERHPQVAVALGDQYAARQDWEKAVDMYSRTITAETNDPELLLKRATAYEQFEDWNAAAADMSRAAVELLGNAGRHELAFETFKKAGRWSEATTFGWMMIEKNPEDKYLWLRLAPVLVLSGDADGYQEYCRRYVEHFRGMTDAGTADAVCKASLLQPGGIALTELPLDALARALDDGTADSGLLSWFWAGRGLAAYRAGNGASAVEYAKKSQQHNPVDLTLALSLAVQALGQQQLGDLDDARRTMESADQLINRLQRSDTDKVHHDLLIPKILLAEAKAAIDGEINPNTTSGAQAAQRTSDGKFLSQAIAEFGKTITDESADFDALSQRARLYEQIRDWDAAAADWSRAAVMQPAGLWLMTEFAQRLNASGQTELAAAQSEEVRRLYEAAIEKDPMDYLAADALTEVLTSAAKDEQWTILTPMEATTRSDAILTRQDDGSILASGNNVSEDVYTIQAEGERDIAAVQLEVLTDASLPNNGPGRHSSGNFQLAAFELFRSSANAPDRRVPVALRHASASFAYAADDADVAGTIDDQINKVWHVWGRTGEKHSARFTLKEPVSLRQGERLIVVLKFRYDLTLGRFRLSTTQHMSDADKLTLVSGPWARLAAAYYLRGEQSKVDKLLEQHPSATAGIGDLMSADQDWEQAIAMYDKALAAEPTSAAILSGRAKAFEMLGNSDAAAADWVLAVKYDPSQQQTIFEKFKQQERWTEAASVGWMLVEKSPEAAMTWLRLAPVLIQAGDKVAYRNLRERLAEQFDETTSADDAAKILKALFLDRGMNEVPKAYEDAITKSLEDGTTAEGTRHFRWGLLGLLASRRGDAELAVENISKSEALKPNDLSHALNLTVLAMSQHQLGDAEQARQALDEASRLIDRLHEDENMRIHHDLMIAQILLHEASERIQGEE